MDESTKSVIEEILAEKARPSRHKAYSTRPLYEPSPEWRRAERERLERERRERAEREERERLERERLERERERQRKAVEEALFKKLSAPAPLVSIEQLAGETAYLSVNPAKACITLRCPVALQLMQRLESLGTSKVRWNGVDQTFEVNPSALPEVKLVLKSFFKDVQVIGVQKAVPATKFDQLLAKLDREDKSKIYRLLAAKYHPDSPRGSHEVMVLINQCFKEG